MTIKDYVEENNYWDCEIYSISIDNNGEKTIRLLGYFYYCDLKPRHSSYNVCFKLDDFIKRFVNKYDDSCFDSEEYASRKEDIYDENCLEEEFSKSSTLGLCRNLPLMHLNNDTKCGFYIDHD